jgi:hypothetical protein
MLKVVPFGVKLSYYAFIASIVPLYIKQYPLINFVNIGQLHILLALTSFLLDTRLFKYMSEFGIFIIQLFWCIDFICETLGIKFLGATTYMYNSEMPLYVRFLSIFHGWFMFFLLYLVKKADYEKRYLYSQLVLSNSIGLLSYYHIDLYNTLQEKY